MLVAAPLTLALVAMDAALDVVTAPVGVGTASGASVFSNSGVVVYVIASPKNARDALGIGSGDTGVALGNAVRSAAGAEGFSDARSNGARGFRTLFSNTPVSSSFHSRNPRWRKGEGGVY